MFVRDKAASKAGKVLVVYSEPEIRRILEVNLAHANLEVVLAESGAEALERIRRDKSYVVILDQELLDMESGDVYRRIKEFSGDVSVILIGSWSKKGNNTTKVDEITVNYVAKPFNPGEVVALVQGHLARKERTMNINPLRGLPDRLRGGKEFSSKKWRSGLPEVDSLHIAMEISRKEAREALKNVQRIVNSLVEKVPPELKDSFDRLAGDVQELAVLCNRSLYLVHDFNSRLETQQDRLLQEESEHLATSEAILNICRNMARLMQVKPLFDPESSQRVIKCALTLAKELGISDVERQPLYQAALLKDIALAFSPPDIIEQTSSASGETAAALKERLHLIWKTLAAIPFFMPVCNLLLYRFERYDGTGGTFGLKGNEIPLCTRVLSVAEAFDSLTSARPPRDKMASGLAIQQIVAESGLSLDPHVVSALLRLWKRNELEFTFSENKGQIGLSVSSE